MLTMDRIHLIRQMYYEQDKNLSEIASETGLDWKTVRKYVDLEDFNIPAPKPETEVNHESKLDPFKPLIDQWLADDKKAKRKQRHSAKRIFERLKKEATGFNCSYRLVADYVSKKKQELSLAKPEGYIPLLHRPGEAQVDFGTADFIENGRLRQDGKYLVMSFPHSNGGYVRLNYGENLECLLEGLKAFFEHIGGVPKEIWFDNTRTIVTKIIKGGSRNLTDRFSRFAEHYRFKPIFMNPESGWEKGNVENKVGYLRRNYLVPVPEFENLPEQNAKLLLACDEDMRREHYDKNRTIDELFEEDRQTLLPLPSVPFDTALYTSVNTDKYGRFTLDEGTHRYSSSPDYFLSALRLKITSSTVTVMDPNMHEIVVHRRLYGSEETESMDWVPYLKWIARKPRSLFNSGIMDMMPPALQTYMHSCESADRGKVLKTLAELTKRTGFESAVRTVDEAVRFKAGDPDSLMNLYRRIYSDVPELPPIDPGNNLTLGKVIPLNTNLTALDDMLKGGVTNG